jgi:hypothetical protein
LERRDFFAPFSFGAKVVWRSAACSPDADV